MAEEQRVSLTVVICCSEDTDLAKALESVDEPQVTVVATITPNRMIEEYLQFKGIEYALTPKGNHARTTNAGIELVTTDAFVIIDSDTVLEPGVLRRTRVSLETNDVVNLPIRFLNDGSSWSQSTAALRYFDNTYDRPAYKPGIAFRRDAKERFGGYWYDERVAWPCDAELLSRIRKYEIPVCHLDEPGIIHRSIPLRHLFRAYYHYGVGDAQQMFVIHHNTHWWPLRNLAFRYRAGLATARQLRSPRFYMLLAGVDAASLSGIVREGIRIFMSGERKRSPKEARG